MLFPHRCPADGAFPKYAASSASKVRHRGAVHPSARRGVKKGPAGCEHEGPPVARGDRRDNFHPVLDEVEHESAAGVAHRNVLRVLGHRDLRGTHLLFYKLSLF